MTTLTYIAFGLSLVLCAATIIQILRWPRKRTHPCSVCDGTGKYGKDMTCMVCFGSGRSFLFPTAKTRRGWKRRNKWEQSQKNPLSGGRYSVMRDGVELADDEPLKDGDVVILKAE